MGTHNILKISYIILLWLLIFENIQSEKCECGIANDDSWYRRIIGGAATSPHRYPWMVALRLGSKLLCGGTLITDKHVLTAGHCINLPSKKYSIEDITVDIGTHDLLARDNIEMRILKGIKHPQYRIRDQSDVNDIAVLTLASKITFNDFVRPICLPKSDMNFQGVDLTLAGWGKTDSEYSKMSRLLRETNVHLVSPNFCKSSFDYKFDTSSMLCAYGREKDACQGDSGGPLFGTRGNRKYYQVGIVSWGSECGDPRYPGVYTDVKKFISWIRSVTTGGKWCT